MSELRLVFLRGNIIPGQWGEVNGRVTTMGFESVVHLDFKTRFNGDDTVSTVLRSDSWFNCLPPLSHFGNDATERSDVRDAGYLDTFAGDPRIDVG